MANPYHIIIELPEGVTESAMAGTGTGSTEGEAAASPGGDSGGRVLTAAKRMVSFAAVKSTADKIVNNNISRVSLTTGATEYEQRLSLVYNAASQTVGAGAAIGMGFVTGGPAGAAVAALAVAANGIQKLIDIYEKEKTLQIQQDLENVSIGMQIVRAGGATVNGSRRNNQ